MHLAQGGDLFAHGGEFIHALDRPRVGVFAVVHHPLVSCVGVWIWISVFGNVPRSWCIMDTLNLTVTRSCHAMPCIKPQRSGRITRYIHSTATFRSCTRPPSGRRPCRRALHPDFGFRVSGFEFRVWEGFGFRVSDFVVHRPLFSRVGSWAWILVSGLGFGFWCWSCVWILVLVSGLNFGVGSGFGFWC